MRCTECYTARTRRPAADHCPVCGHSRIVSAPVVPHGPRRAELASGGAPSSTRAVITLGETKDQPDCQGWRPVLITADMVGRVIGQHVAPEIEAGRTVVGRRRSRPRPGCASSLAHGCFTGVFSDADEFQAGARGASGAAAAARGVTGLAPPTGGAGRAPRYRTGEQWQVAEA
ncbi:MAG: hypothetical protein MZW92_36250 [Comamonadaceae bacterium]|nr:hypothetical protein [Comamonadaceae bacterium]